MMPCGSCVGWLVFWPGKPGKGPMNPPTDPLKPRSFGQARAIAAWALHTLGDWPVRLVWCVDLRRDVGPEADYPKDPTNPYEVETQWGSYLQRFRDALDRQPHGPANTPIGLVTRHNLPDTGEGVEVSFRLPYGANLACIAGGAPPVGVWRIGWIPPRQKDPLHGHESLEFEGDRLPDSFWYNGIPF